MLKKKIIITICVSILSAGAVAGTAAGGVVLYKSVHKLIGNQKKSSYVFSEGMQELDGMNQLENSYTYKGLNVSFPEEVLAEEITNLSPSSTVFAYDYNYDSKGFYPTEAGKLETDNISAFVTAFGVGSNPHYFDVAITDVDTYKNYDIDYAGLGNEFYWDLLRDDEECIVYLWNRSAQEYQRADKSAEEYYYGTYTLKIMKKNSSVSYLINYYAKNSEYRTINFMTQFAYGLSFENVAENNIASTGKTSKSKSENGIAGFFPNTRVGVDADGNYKGVFANEIEDRYHLYILSVDYSSGGEMNEDSIIEQQANRLSGTYSIAGYMGDYTIYKIMTQRFGTQYLLFFPTNINGYSVSNNTFLSISLGDLNNEISNEEAVEFFRKKISSL